MARSIPKLKEVIRASEFKIAKPKDYWKAFGNQQNFFNELGAKLGIDYWEKWYSVTIEEIRNHGGAPLLQNYFNNSLYEALSIMYPGLAVLKFDNLQHFLGTNGNLISAKVSGQRRKHKELSLMILQR